MSMFTGELVRLTQIQRSDLPAFTHWFRDYEIQRLLAIDAAVPATDEAEEEFYQLAVKKSGDAFYFSIRTLERDILIGNCGLTGINQKNRCSDFGIVIGEKEYWGGGYGSDAAQIILRFAFEELNLNRVQLEVFGYNSRAIHCYEKVGFVQEGSRRQAIFREGTYHDVITMAALREGWDIKME
ncbi:MAG: GNAT family N-acetyltransferase [Anaerolineae bacterium]|nr:GNAT family N-acetyltransferase [Anaerolineae bacterium]